MATLGGHSEDGKFLNGLCVRGSGCDVRFSVTIMVGLLELRLLVWIGLGV